MEENTAPSPISVISKKKNNLGLVLLVLAAFIVGGLLSSLGTLWLQKQVVADANRTYDQADLRIKEYEAVKNQLQACNDQKQNSQENQIALLDSCTGQQCLFQEQEAVVGFGILKGYYSTKDTIDWGDTPVTCDVLVITGGNEKLIHDLTGTVVNDGNSINKVDEQGRLLVNLELDQILASDKNKILNSTKDSPVSLGVIRTSPQWRGWPACGSFLSIISVAN